MNIIDPPGETTRGNADKWPVTALVAVALAVGRSWRSWPTLVCGHVDRRQARLRECGVDLPAMIQPRSRMCRIVRQRVTSSNGTRSVSSRRLVGFS